MVARDSLMAKRAILLVPMVGILIFCSWITVATICNTGWRRIERNDFPWNGPNIRAAQYQKTSYNFPHTRTEERWENADGEMIAYWPTFSNAIDCLKKSELMNQIIGESKIRPNETTTPYQFYLVSIDPEIVIVSEQAKRKFDYYNMFVLPSTDIPPSLSLYWLNPESNSEPTRIKLDDDGSGTFSIRDTRMEIRRNEDDTINVTRTSP
jgi:hypothetical protein